MTYFLHRRLKVGFFPRISLSYKASMPRTIFYATVLLPVKCRTRLVVLLLVTCPMVLLRERGGAQGPHSIWTVQGLLGLAGDQLASQHIQAFLKVSLRAAAHLVAVLQTRLFVAQQLATRLRA